MKFTKSRYEELFEIYKDFLRKLVDSKSHVSASAALHLQMFEQAKFNISYWVTFPQKFKALLAMVDSYVRLDGEDGKIQVQISRMLPILRIIEPSEFVESYKVYQKEMFGAELSEKFMKDSIADFLLELNTMYRYKEGTSNSEAVDFDLLSVDGKRKISVYVSLDKKGEIAVEASATYDDGDFAFEVDEIKFDMLQFKTINNCINHIISKIALKASMKINGTRIRIGQHIFVLTTRDMATVRATLLTTGEGKLFSVNGDLIRVSTQPNGKVVDKVASKLLAVTEKLYYFVDLNSEIDNGETPVQVVEKVEEEEAPQPIKPKSEAAIDHTNNVPTTTAPPAPPKAVPETKVEEPAPAAEEFSEDELTPEEKAELDALDAEEAESDKADAEEEIPEEDGEGELSEELSEEEEATMSALDAKLSRRK